MKNNEAIYEITKFKHEPDQNLSQTSKQIKRQPNQPDDDAFDGVLWIRKYRDITFFEGLYNFMTFLWKGDPNQKMVSDIDNLTKDPRNFKNVESVITSASDEKLMQNKEANDQQRFKDIRFTDVELDTYRTT